MFFSRRGRRAALNNNSRRTGPGRFRIAAALLISFSEPSAAEENWIIGELGPIQLGDNSRSVCRMSARATAKSPKISFKIDRVTTESETNQNLNTKINQLKSQPCILIN